jgi:hypothetical protein
MKVVLRTARPLSVSSVRQWRICPLTMNQFAVIVEAAAVLSAWDVDD